MGGLKSPPLPPRELLRSAAVTQELEIATTNHRKATFHQANYGVAQGRGLPRSRCHTPLPVDGNGNLAVAGTVHSTVDGLQLQAQASALIRCHTGVRRERPSLTGTPETGQRLDAAEGIGVKRDQGRERAVRSGIGKDQILR